MADGFRKDLRFSNAPADRRIRQEWAQVSGPFARQVSSTRGPATPANLEQILAKFARRGLA